MMPLIWLISFHLAVFFLAAIISFLPLANIINPDTQKILWLSISLASVLVISLATRAYSLSLWAFAKPSDSSKVIMLGHLGPAIAFYFYQAMKSTSTGSGLIFIPIAAWAIFFYGIGLLAVIFVLTKARSRQKAGA